MSPKRRKSSNPTYILSNLAYTTKWLSNPTYILSNIPGANPNWDGGTQEIQQTQIWAMCDWILYQLWESIVKFTDWDEKSE